MLPCLNLALGSLPWSRAVIWGAASWREGDNYTKYSSFGKKPLGKMENCRDHAADKDGGREAEDYMHPPWLHQTAVIRQG